MDGRLDVGSLSDREAREEAAALANIELALLGGEGWEAATLGVTYGISEHVPVIMETLWTAGRINDQGLAAVLPDVWITNKAPIGAVSTRRWVRMFKASGYICLVSETTGVPSAYPMQYSEAPPTGPLTVWRGATVESHGRGMSWSLYPECAREFAQVRADSCGHAGLFRVDLPGRAVLGMFADSREQEVVVNPDFLRGRIELVDEFSESAESAERRVRLAGVFGIDPVRLIPGSTTGGRHADGRN